MSLVDLNIYEFMNQVDSESPAPGGGSVAALAAALGVGLSRMVGHLTINKKKFLALDEAIQKQYEQHFEQLLFLKDQIIPLIDKDTEAFNLIMTAFKMPKETEEEKQVRLLQIEQATLEAIKVPYEVAQLSHDALAIIEQMLDYGNKNAITDIGVGSLLLYSGLEGAILNVKINLSGLSDQEKVDYYEKNCYELLNKGKRIKDVILLRVHEEVS